MTSRLRNCTSKHGRPIIICWTICLSFIWWSFKTTSPGGRMVFLVTVRLSSWRCSRKNPAKKVFCVFLELPLWNPERKEHVPHRQNGQPDTQYSLNCIDFHSAPKSHTYHLGDAALFQISLVHSPQNHGLCAIPALSWSPDDLCWNYLDAQNKAHGLFLCCSDLDALKGETHGNPNYYFGKRRQQARVQEKYIETHDMWARMDLIRHYLFSKL